MEQLSALPNGGGGSSRNRISLDGAEARSDRDFSSGQEANCELRAPPYLRKERGDKDGAPPTTGAKALIRSGRLTRP